MLALRTIYYPVAGFWKLLRVTLRTSQWHLFSLRGDLMSMSARHLIPALFVASIGALLLASVSSHMASIGLIAVLLTYLLAGICVAGMRSRAYGPADRVHSAVRLSVFSHQLWHWHVGGTSLSLPGTFFTADSGRAMDTLGVCSNEKESRVNREESTVEKALPQSDMVADSEPGPVPIDQFVGETDRIEPLTKTGRAAGVPGVRAGTEAGFSRARKEVAQDAHAVWFRFQAR